MGSNKRSMIVSDWDNFTGMELIPQYMLYIQKKYPVDFENYKEIFPLNTMQLYTRFYWIFY